MSQLHFRKVYSINNMQQITPREITAIEAKIALMAAEMLEKAKAFGENGQLVVNIEFVPFRKEAIEKYE